MEKNIILEKELKKLLDDLKVSEDAITSIIN